MAITNLIPTDEETETRGHIDPMHPELARRTVKWYVCSRCWGDLTTRNEHGGVAVECVNCKEETCGYVSKYWTDRKRSADHFEYVEVKRMLERIGILPKPDRSREVLLKEIGF